MLERGWRKRNPPTLLVRIYVGAATIEIVWRFLRKPKIELRFDPALLHLDIDLDKTNLKRCMHPYVHRSTIHNSQDI